MSGSDQSVGSIALRVDKMGILKTESGENAY